MKDIIPAKKQSPILGLTGMGGGVGSNLGGSLAKKTYVDDVFSNWVYTGNNSARNEPNGIDLADKGGLVWIKDRDQLNNHVLFDTERGTTKMLRLGGTSAAQEVVGNPEVFSSFDSNGFTHGWWSGTGTLSRYASWTWAQQEGFFDVVKWTGNGVSGRQIPHDLGSVPGFVMTKALDNGDGWRTLHSWDFSKILYISGNNAGTGSSSQAFTAAPDATNLYVTADGAINASGQEYIAYIFAGGPSTAATAKSVDLDGAGDALITSASLNDYSFGTGDFTVEHWIYSRDHSYVQQTVDMRTSTYNNNTQWCTYIDTDGKYKFFMGGNRIVSDIPLMKKQWQHCAIVRSSGNTKMYINGIQQIQKWVDSTNYTTDKMTFGGHGPDPSSYSVDAIYSQVRVVKGQALYTTSFKPPTEPLTTTSQGATASNVKLLCCQNATATGSTVGTVVAHTAGNTNPTVTTSNPFSDPESFKFGDDGDQDLIKGGSYIGNTSTPPEIYCGWEPQFIMIKDVSQAMNWFMFDNMQGITTADPATAGNENYLYPNLNNTEYTADRIELTPTGFKVVTSGGSGVTTNGDEYIYFAIRRPDGLVGKPVEAGTDVWATDVRNTTQSADPAFDSGFPADFSLMKKPTVVEDWFTNSRLTQDRYLLANNPQAEIATTYMNYEYMKGMGTGGLDATYYAWMWKRHAGFDVVTYAGNGDAGRQIPHSLNKTPEMMWVKERNGSRDWQVYHKGLNGGTNPAQYYLELNANAGEQASADRWYNTAPTSTHFIVGGTNIINHNFNNVYIAMLFASVTGISKCGYYDGQNTELAITTGFQPRFLLIKKVNAGGNWFFADTNRGWGATDQILQLNESAAQFLNNDFGAPTATGFTLKGAETGWNEINQRYIYYAHA